MERNPWTFGERHVAEDERARATLLWMFVGTLAGLAVGIFAFWPYLVEEHRRLRPWQWIPMWLGDLSALFWFLTALVSPSPPPQLRSGRRTDAERRHHRRAFLVSMAVAVAIDFTHTAHLHWQESRDFATADVVQGEVTSVRIREGTDTTRYRVRVRFSDRANRVHEEPIRVQRGDLHGLPMNTRKALVSGRVPFPVRVSFDPSLPPRCWLTDVGYDDGDRVYAFSYVVLMVQAGGIALFGFLLHEQHRKGNDPRWEGFLRPLPLMITAAFFLIFGPLEALVGNLRQ